jgi:hypothetical protein
MRPTPRKVFAAPLMNWRRVGPSVELMNAFISKGKLNSG